MTLMVVLLSAAHFACGSPWSPIRSPAEITTGELVQVEVAGRTFVLKNASHCDEVNPATGKSRPLVSGTVRDDDAFIDSTAVFTGGCCSSPSCVNVDPARAQLSVRKSHDAMVAAIILVSVVGGVALVGLMIVAIFGKGF